MARTVHHDPFNPRRSPACPSRAGRIRDRRMHRLALVRSSPRGGRTLDDRTRARRRALAGSRRTCRARVGRRRPRAGLRPVGGALAPRRDFGRCHPQRRSGDALFAEALAGPLHARRFRHRLAEPAGCGHGPAVDDHGGPAALERRPRTSRSGSRRTLPQGGHPHGARRHRGPSACRGRCVRRRALRTRERQGRRTGPGVRRGDARLRRGSGWRMGQVADVDTLRAAARSSEARVRALGAKRQLTVSLGRLSGIVGTQVLPQELVADGEWPPAPTTEGVRGELAAAREVMAAASTQSHEAALALLPSFNSRLAVSQYAPANGGAWERRWMVAVTAELAALRRWPAGERLRAARAQAEQARAGTRRSSATWRWSWPPRAPGRRGARSPRGGAVADAPPPRRRFGLPMRDTARACCRSPTCSPPTPRPPRPAPARSKPPPTSMLSHFRLLHAMGELR